MLLLLVPILPFPVKETPALILRFAPLHLECCLCRNSLPPSPSIFHLVICSYRISPLFYIFFILQFASLHLECCPLFITRPHAPHCIS